MSKIYIKHNRSHKSKNFAQRLLSINTKNDAHEHFIMSPVSVEARRTSKKIFCEIKWMMYVYVCRMNVYNANFNQIYDVTDLYYFYHIHGTCVIPRNPEYTFIYRYYIYSSNFLSDWLNQFNHNNYFNY